MNIKKIRESANLTQEQAAKIANCLTNFIVKLLGKIGIFFRSVYYSRNVIFLTVGEVSIFFWWKEWVQVAVARGHDRQTNFLIFVRKLLE